MEDWKIDSVWSQYTTERFFTIYWIHIPSTWDVTFLRQHGQPKDLFKKLFGRVPIEYQTRIEKSQNIDQPQIQNFFANDESSVILNVRLFKLLFSFFWIVKNGLIIKFHETSSLNLSL